MCVFKNVNVATTGKVKLNIHTLTCIAFTTEPTEEDEECCPLLRGATASAATKHHVTDVDGVGAAVAGRLVHTVLVSGRDAAEQLGVCIHYKLVI